MGRIVVTEFISLDGVIEDPGGAEGFKHGGWTFAFNTGDEGDQFKLEETMAAEALLLGRVTYDGFAAAWPTMEGTGAFGEKMNGMPKYVVSSTLQNAEWSNSTVLRGDPVEEVAKLKNDVDGVILVGGSAQLAQTLIEHDLVDEIRLMVFPVVLGTGKRLFGDTSDRKPLKLTESRTVGEDGVAIMVYQPAPAG
jgi:dihydrofolate reductase